MLSKRTGQRSNLETHLVVGGGVVSKHKRMLIGGAPGGGSTPQFNDNGGTVIEIVRLQLIYWGAAWGRSPAPNPSSGQIDDAARTFLSVPI